MISLKKTTIVAVFFTILFCPSPLFPQQEIKAASYNNLMTCEKAYDAQFPGQNPPTGYDKCNTKFRFFNYKLYLDQQVVAYGKVEATNTRAADFKSDWQDLAAPPQMHSNKEMIGVHPYYRNQDGIKGEYRYYGWDKLGNLYTNPYFLDDANSGKDPDLKKWIYRPWGNNPLMSGIKNGPKGFSPFYGGINDPDDIYKTLGLLDKVNKVIKSKYITVDNPYVSKTNPALNDPRREHSLFDFMYVEQAPTTAYQGQGRMYHKNADGSVWYQSFPIDTLDVHNKEKPGVQATILEEVGGKPQTYRNDLAMLEPKFNWSWTFKSEIKDQIYIDDPLQRTLWYTRYDLKKWVQEITLTHPGGTVSKTLSSEKNGDLALQENGRVALSILSQDFDKSKMKKGDNVQINLVTHVYYKSISGSMVFDTDRVAWERTFDGSPIPPPTIIPPAPVDGPLPFVCTPHIPDDAFDIVAFGASDDTDMSRVASRSVSVEGTPVDPDLFFGGGYVFGDAADGLKVVSMHWTPKPGEDENGVDGSCTTYRIVHVHDTKPRAQFKLFGGSFKENRKMSIDNTSDDPDANDALVLATYPNIQATWSWGSTAGSDADRRMKADTEDHKEFLYKKPGEYRLTLTVTNALGRTSDPYILDFSVIEDRAPAVILHPYSSQISRTDPVTLFYDAVSTDGDIITNQNFKVYYDADGNETYSQLIDSFSGVLSQYKPASQKLGNYRIVATVDEDFGQETFPEFITAADKRQSTTHFEFEVDNYIPYADLFTDIPSIRQQIDVSVMLDKNLAQSKIDYVISNGVTINNQLRLEGTDPLLNLWDMHTYTHSQPGSTVNHTGSYPPNSTSYCSGGYCGTLNLQSVSDNGYYRDYGQNVQVVDVPGHDQIVVDVPGHNMSVVDVAGHYERVVDVPGHNVSRTETYPWCLSKTGNHAPPCQYGSSSTTKTRTVTVWVPATYKNVYVPTTFKTVYVPTTYKTVYVPTTYKTVWMPNIRWVNDYYGTYSGTIYKNVRQPLVNPFSRTIAAKYVIYISDSMINELSDFNAIKGLSDGKVILVGTNAMKAQISYDFFIPNTGQSIENIITDIVAYIASNNPPTARQTVLINETFQLLTDESDPESDPLVQKQTMYVHNEHHFDNPAGRADFARQSYDVSGYTDETLKSSFAQPGQYDIYRRVKDQPSADPKFAKYGYYSNEAETIIFAHRKPFAKAALDWTYDTSCSCYLTTWVDESYDLDHNVSDPVNKGIVDRKIRYQVGGEWFYRIPNELAAGTYHLEYRVKDLEGAWSDPLILDFTLAAAPPPQLKGNVQAEDTAFTLPGGIPAGERVIADQLWTRHPVSLNLQLMMSVSGNYINKLIPYYTGTKTGNDISWNDETTVIPATTPDGTYTYRILAAGSNGTSAFLDFPLKVMTPIQLKPELRTADGQSTTTVSVGQPITIAASTTEYANQVSVTAFKGQSFEKSFTLNGAVMSTAGTGSKQWNLSFTPAKPIADGTYTFEWTARTLNGNIETKTMTIQAVNNTVPMGDFIFYTYHANNPSMPIFEGDSLHIRSQNVMDNERDPLAVRYEVLDPSGVKRLDNTATVTYPYLPSGPDLVLPEGASAVGTWTIKQTVSDGKAPPLVRTRTMVVRALGVQGAVKHTEAWEANRLRYNEKHPDTKRPPDWFWAGEAFVLEATVTDTGTSGTRPVSVVAAAFPDLRKELTIDVGSPVWEGLLRSEDAGEPLDKLPQGAYSFVFTVTYSNGTVKTSTVTIRLRDKIDDFVQVHRIQ